MELVGFRKSKITLVTGGSPRSVMATTPDSHAGGPHAGGPGFVSRCRPTNFGAHLPYTPPPSRKDVSTVKGPERDGVRESRAPRMTKKL